MNKIFEIGLSRTGTRSLCTAAHILGFHSIHGLSPREKHIDYDYRRGLQKDFMEKIAVSQFDWDVCKDFDYIGHLGAPFFQQLDREYPGSKFILTTRPLDEWVGPMKVGLETPRTVELLRIFNGGQIDFGILWRLLLYKSVAFTPENLAVAREHHNRAVMEYFAERDNFLVFPLGSGWEPLCRFLDRPTPYEPYPWVKKGRPLVPLKGE